MSFDVDETAQPGKLDTQRRMRVFEKIDAEIVLACQRHGVPRWGRHEALSIIREEFEEAWDEVKVDSSFEDGLLLKELVQLAAMVVRYIETEPRFNLEPR